ncbi:hypothetical protein MNV49_001307 [Pseudohyphozyma bogoriensis]|nr:hypothetical protein MNV49_001307 [Pseudohyphozyma bogoriensis]
MANPPERRRVLGSSPQHPFKPLAQPTHSPTSIPPSKPLKARVDPSAFASPSTPTQRPPATTRPRAQVTPSPYASASARNPNSAPSTPQTTPFVRASPSYSNLKTLSPTVHTPSPGGRRSPSPVRVRSPDRTPRPVGGTGAGGAGGVTGPVSAKAHAETFPRYLPSTASTRNSPTTTAFASRTTSPSPLTSPTLSSTSSTHRVTVQPQSIPRRQSSSSGLSYSGTSSSAHSDLSASTSTSGGLLPPLNLPLSPLSTSPSGSSTTSTHSYLLHSPTSHTSPTLSSAPPSRRPTRPPSVNSNAAARHTRSHSVASTSSSAGASTEDGGGSVAFAPAHARNFSTFAGAGGAVGGGVGGPKIVRANSDLNHGTGLGVGVIAVGKQAEVVVSEEEKEEAARRESEEKEAKVNRKILDLEITNASLLTINASLELLKLRHTKEIRDLRRKLRESRLLAPLASPLPNEHLHSPNNSDYEDSDDENEENATWEELLAADERFAGCATVLESLLRRGKEAVVYRVERAEGLVDEGQFSGTKRTREPTHVEISDFVRYSKGDMSAESFAMTLDSSEETFLRNIKTKPFTVSFSGSTRELLSLFSPVGSLKYRPGEEESLRRQGSEILTTRIDAIVGAAVEEASRLQHEAPITMSTRDRGDQPTLPTDEFFISTEHPVPKATLLVPTPEGVVSPRLEVSGLLDYAVVLVSGKEHASLTDGKPPMDLLEPIKSMLSLVEAKRPDQFQGATAQLQAQLLALLELTGRRSFAGILSDGSNWVFYVAQAEEGGRFKIYRGEPLRGEKGKDLEIIVATIVAMLRSPGRLPEIFGLGDDV